MDLLIGVISNCIFGAMIRIKEIIGKQIKKKNYKNEIKSLIQQEFKIDNKKINIKNIEEFFSISQIKDLIEEFLLLEATRFHATTLKKTSTNISIDAFINMMIEKYTILYCCSKEEQSIIKDIFEFIFSFCEEKVFNSLKIDDKSTIYFINSRAEERYNLIENHLNQISEKINKLMNQNLEKQNVNYDIIKNNYYKILKERYSEAHIYLLDKFAFDEFYVPPRLFMTSSKNTNKYEMIYNREYNNAISWNEIFLKNNIVYVIGGAGYGKSLFLRKIINDYMHLLINDPNEYLIVLGELKMFYPNNSEMPIPVDQFIVDSIKANTLLGDEITLDFVHHYLNMGRCLILLDALDEVDKSRRKDLHEKIIAYFKNQNPNNKICITSRDRGFIPEKNIEVYQIRHLNKVEIEKYVDNIIKLGKFDEKDKASFMQQTWELTKKGFLSSFLVLSLLLNIYKAERELPENKLDLYSKCFEYITVKREKEKTKDRFDWLKISLLLKDNTFMALSQLGYPNNKDIDKNIIITELTQIYSSKYSNANETENAIEEFLKFCSDRTELFVPSNSDDKFKFFHRSFFEYFYALFLFVNYTNSNDLLEKLKVFDVDSEVFELTMSMFKQRAESKYQDILDLIFTKSELELRNRREFSCFNILTLIMQVVDDVQYKEKFFNLIIDYKDAIVQNMRKLYNLNILPIILQGFKNYEKKICDAYNKESIIMLLQLLSMMLEIYDRDSSYFKEIEIELDDVYYDKTFYHRRDFHFFFDLFVKNTNLINLLNSLDESKLRVLGVSNKKYAKSLNNFKSKNLDLQKTILSKIEDDL